jgi:hypothetical protein
MIGHVAGAPVEELLPLLTGVGAAALLSRAWVVARLRRPVKTRDTDAPDV